MALLWPQDPPQELLQIVLLRTVSIRAPRRTYCAAVSLSIQWQCKVQGTKRHVGRGSRATELAHKNAFVCSAAQVGPKYTVNDYPGLLAPYNVVRNFYLSEDTHEYAAQKAALEPLQRAQANVFLELAQQQMMMIKTLASL